LSDFIQNFNYPPMVLSFVLGSKFIGYIYWFFDCWTPTSTFWGKFCY